MSGTDLELAQLLCTRLCHDLAGPIGAVAAGVELMGDDPAAIDAETLGLVGGSSTAASRKLKFMRAAFGANAGGALDLKDLLDGYLESVAGPNGRVALTWPTPASTAAVAGILGARWNQVLLNLCLLGLEVQPGCRAMTVACADRPARIMVEVRGAPDRAATIRDEFKAAVEGAANPLSAKTVQAYLAGCMIRAAGGKVDWSAAGDRIQLTASFAS